MEQKLIDFKIGNLYKCYMTNRILKCIAIQDKPKFIDVCDPKFANKNKGRTWKLSYLSLATEKDVIERQEELNNFHLITDDLSFSVDKSGKLFLVGKTDVIEVSLSELNKIVDLATKGFIKQSK